MISQGIAALEKYNQLICIIDTQNIFKFYF